MELGLDIPNEVNKKIFKLKPVKSNGLILRMYHTLFNKRFRFIHSCFHPSKKTIALADTCGNIFIIDFSSNKFWGLPEIQSSTFIHFSELNENHLLTGIEKGDIFICNMQSGHISGKLLGHNYSVTNVSFTKHKFLLSASKYEAIVWDLEFATKLQVLNLEEDCSLKYVTFIPSSGNILACFQDDLIQIWSHEKFETLKQFSPSNWKNYSVKCVSFTSNGEIMVVAGHLPSLSIFNLDTSKLLKTISLSDYLQMIKRTEFVSMIFDGGCNKILAILSGHGVIYFLNVQENIVISELQCNTEINRFVCSFTGNYLLCLLCSGEVELYNIQQYVAPPVEIQVQKVLKKFKINRRRCLEEVKYIKEEIDSLLDIKKLKYILKEYGEYPEMYRMKIWEHLLELPNNLYKYNSVINHVTIMAFDNLYEKYPLEDKIFLKGLKKLLNNLVTWCPFFANIEYLPIFTFPFVKIFHNTPLMCFEAVCTVILNWCQHWFEYFPLAPINILAIAENVLLEHDPVLLHHFVTLNITSNLYIWALLETAFSEVLTSTDWLILWDHILTNEISFLLCACVAYSMVQRHILLSLNIQKDFEFFYKNQNPIDTKRLIKVSYCLVKTTSEKFHPRQYLKSFTGIEKGNYPLFIEYPKAIIDVQNEEINKLDGHMVGLLAEKDSLLKEKKNVIDDVIAKQHKEEEKRRLKEMKNIYSMQLKSKQKILNEEQQKMLEIKKSYSQKYPTNIVQKLLGDELCPTNQLQENFEKRQRNKKVDKLWTNHQKKLQMAMHIELVNKFIKTIENELNDGNEKLDKLYGLKFKGDSEKDIGKDRRKEALKVLHVNKKFGLRTIGKKHGTEECLCDTNSQKTVRFSESTTGGSADYV